jgi:hypothetical protein
VLSESGDKIRVSSEEYKTGKYKHVCEGRIMVRLLSTGEIVSIHKDEYDQIKHVTQFKDHVLCYDNVNRCTTKIPKSEFYSNEDRYFGITKGLIMAKNRVTNEIVQVSKDEFDANADLVGITYGFFPAIDKETGKTVIIGSNEYDKSRYSHPNAGQTVQFSLTLRKRVSISTEEYRANPYHYANTATKCFILRDGFLFRSLKDFREYIRTKEGIVIRSEMKHALKRIPDLETITLSEFIESDKNYVIYEKNQNI